MRKLIPLFLLTLSAPAFAQSVIAINPQQCVWRTGDDSAWAVPSLDESGWQSNPNWQGLFPAAHLWVRCHSDLSSLQNEKQPALQITLYGAYRLFLKGEPIGAAGDIRSGAFSMSAIRQYPLKPTGSEKRPETIAVRITYRPYGQSPITNAQNMDPPIILAGNLAELIAQRDHVVLSESSNFMPGTLVYSLIGVLGLTLFGPLLLRPQPLGPALCEPSVP